MCSRTVALCQRKALPFESMKYILMFTSVAVDGN